MSGIVICSQCGFQTEADKRFCPNCGAPIEPARYTEVIPSTRQAAASALFSNLQAKKESNGDTTAEVQSTPAMPSQPIRKDPPITDVKERPKTFVKKPLGVAKPQHQEAKAAPKLPSTQVKDQLIEFLKELNKLDRTLEASAVVRRDGTLLASAHSSRAKPEMMATISSTLYSIAIDSIRAISGGKMRMVTITAEQCVLMLTNVDKDTILILVTSPKSNLGLVSMYSELMAQNIAKFLAKLS
ncbi:MAG: hypothetical protein EU536_05020 [Promethearchaeota archaeon]|nr:MAG: hypothetical protein EU536_05020 [Candidatus Lokiarchaeota archaeon]